ncbi:hypothetical protein KAR91_59620 [Candidatus Pacearchaeota archaeon]|nr:hypothetical protein [Candidatus Pacearchaeota archaeon]
MVSEVKIYVRGDGEYHLRIDFEEQSITALDNGEPAAGVNIEGMGIEDVECAIDCFVHRWCRPEAIWDYLE